MTIPIVTLDKIYLDQTKNNIYFIDCTRINGINEIVSRRGLDIDSQIDYISNILDSKEIFLADDVVFSGSVLRTIINKFKEKGIEVVGIITSVCTNSSYINFNEQLKYGIRTNYIMLDDVIDQICERDFYFGIAGSGIMVKTPNGLMKAPYFKPYGNPNERASIPVEYEDEFSIGCINRSISLWEEIDRLKKLKTKILELPEKIVNTNENDEIVKTLKREMK